MSFAVPRNHANLSMTQIYQMTCGEIGPSSVLPGNPRYGFAVWPIPERDHRYVFLNVGKYPEVISPRASIEHEHALISLRI